MQWKVMEIKDVEGGKEQRSVIQLKCRVNMR